MSGLSLFTKGKKISRTAIKTTILIVIFSALSQNCFLQAKKPDHIQTQNPAYMKGKPKPTETPLCEPNEIIVKFKKTVNLGPSNASIMINAASIQSGDPLDGLNKICPIKSVEKIFKNFKKTSDQMEAIALKDRSMLTKKELRLLKRKARNPNAIKPPGIDRIYKVTVEPQPGQTLQDIVKAYKKDHTVEYAELNYLYSITATPNDPHYPLMWSLENTAQMYPESGRYNDPPGTVDKDIDASAAWDIYTGNHDVIVAVIDTGVDYNHRDLQLNMWADPNGKYGYDFYNDDDDPMDDYGHGTHCAGTIAASGNNGIDTVGVCHKAKIMSLKFIGASGSGPLSAAMSAFDYAIANGADITSNSWTGPASESIRETIEYAWSMGLITVVAAANSNTSNFAYPAAYDHVIAVAATDSNDDRATFSNYGSWVEIAAPGVDILSLLAAGTYYAAPYDDFTTIVSGTSMACPHVAGASALMLSINPSITNDDMTTLLQSSSDTLADSNICASGRLNLYQAAIDAVAAEATIILDRAYYNCSDSIDILLTDPTIAAAGTSQVAVMSTHADAETLTLTEVPTAPGVFKGAIDTGSGDANPGDGTIQLSHDSIITVTYRDTNNDLITDSALADCLAPALPQNISLSILGPQVTITFDTTERPFAQILYGTACGGPYTASGITRSNSHEITLRDLTPFTDYHYVIKLTDLADNSITDDNSGSCYQFTTDGPTTVYVPSTKYAVIQSAINDTTLWPESKIVVAPGVYNEWLSFNGRAVTLTSTDPNDPAVVAATIIDPSNLSGIGVRFLAKEDSRSVLCGLTIVNSSSYAVYCSNSSPTIKNCLIKENPGTGILCISSAAPTITNNIIRSNGSWGIIASFYASPVIKNNWITDNLHGVRFVAAETTLFSSNTIVNNTDLGLSNWTSGPPPQVINSIIYKNGTDLDNCTAAYSCLTNPADAGDTQVTHNIAADPRFVSPDQMNYHLVGNSPCIDAGNPTGTYVNETDIDTKLRVADGNFDSTAIIDIGADEANCPFLTEHLDYNNDGKVNLNDIAVISAAYLLDSAKPGFKSECDLDCDNNIDFDDVKVFTANWLVTP